MSLSPHHQNQLHLIEAGLLRSDPQLAARLSVFGRLCAGQAMPAWEQVSSRHDRIRQAAALTGGRPASWPRPSSCCSRRSSPWSPPWCRVAAPGRPRNGANGPGPGRVSGAGKNHAMNTARPSSSLNTGGPGHGYSPRW